MARTAVVTGGSGGIGRATVEELEADHNVVVHYHSNETAATELVEKLDGKTDAIAVRADVADRESVADLFERARDEFGTVDVLVNNAAAPPESGFEDRSVDSVDRQIRVNLNGVVYCSQEVVGEMVDSGYGRIVNVASTAGLHGSPSDPVYGATKGGVVGFTKSLAKRYTEAGILTNAVAPSVTDTPLLPAERRESAAELFPQNRIVEPAEVADAVRFLVSKAYSSGKVVEIAGGRYL